ncbi:MAG: hypothetical protein ACRDNK_03190 [Solirubrobacteraceae bacterium]
MQFNPDEYLLLSRRGSVPSPKRRGSPPEPELRVRARPATARASRLRTVVRGRVHAAAALRGAVHATWTAFGNSPRDL